MAVAALDTQRYANTSLIFIALLLGARTTRIMAASLAAVLKKFDFSPAGYGAEWQMVCLSRSAPQISHRRRPGEFDKLAVEMRLIAVTRLGGDRRQGHRIAAAEQAQGVLEAQHAQIGFWRKPHGATKVRDETSVAEAALSHQALDRWQPVHRLQHRRNGRMHGVHAWQTRRQRGFQDGEPVLAAPGFEQSFAHAARGRAPEVFQQRMPFGQLAGGRTEQKLRCAWAQYRADRTRRRRQLPDVVA